MSRRLVLVAVGVPLGVLAVRGAAALAERMEPGSTAHQLLEMAGQLVADVRAAMREREQELRSALGLGVGGAAADTAGGYGAALEPHPGADDGAQRMGG